MVILEFTECAIEKNINIRYLISLKESRGYRISFDAKGLR